MSSGQKAALSFLTALVLFAGFVFFAHTGLMAQIETKFYAQTKINEKDDQLQKLSQSCNSYISDILTKIQTGDKAFLKESAVKTYVHQNPSEKEATERKNLTAELFDQLEVYGLDGLRLIEKNGRTLHYSSYESDVLKRVSLNTTYKLYTDVIKDSGELEGDLVLVDSDKPETKLLLDKAKNRIIISFPFYVTDNTFFATLVAYFDIHSIEQQLVNEKIINFGDAFALLTEDSSYQGGFVLGMPKASQSEFTAPVIRVWNKTKNSGKEAGLERILEKEDGSYWLLMTSSQSEYFNVSAVYSSTLFELPRELEYLIYASVFMTLLLLAALLFNLKRDYLAVIKSRIKKVQFGIITEYLENKEKVEWSQVARQLENRKSELSEEIKKSIGGKSKKYSKEVDAYLDSSWEEIIGLLKAQTGGEENSAATAGGASIEEIRRVIEEVLKSSKLNVNVNSVPQVQEVSSVPEPVEDLEEDLEAVEEIEPVEEIEEVEEAEPVEEIEEVEEAEPVEEIEEVEEAEPVEEIEEVEEAEPVEEIEEVEEAEPVEEIEEVEEAEPVEEIEEVEEAEPVEEIEEIEEAEPVEEIEEVEETSGVPEPVEEQEEELEELEEFVIDQPDLEEPGAHFFVSNDDPRFHEDYYIGELSSQGSPVEYSQESEPLTFDFIVEPPEFFIKTEEVESLDEVEEEVEDLEDAPASQEAYFVMTRFGQNEEPVIELKGDKEEANSAQNSDTIIEQNGVYSISQNLSYTNVFLNQEFKTLVDSVLQK